jgi:hypothetical protein
MDSHHEIVSNEGRKHKGRERTNLAAEPTSAYGEDVNIVIS